MYELKRNKVIVIFLLVIILILACYVRFAISADSSNVETWGVNRAGHSFTTVINTPIVVNSSCGWYAPISGEKTHTVNSRVSTITFGTDANGNIVSSGCPNHYLLNWTTIHGVAKSYVGTY